MRSRVKLQTIASFSVWATALTTSHNTPINMFITVRLDSSTNNQINAAQCGTSCPTSRTTWPKLSMKVPSMSNVYIASITEPKYLAPMSSSSVNCLKAMPKTYKRITSKQSVNMTERVAATMPLTRMSSSGIARNSRTILAILDSLSNRAIRKMEALPNPPPEPPPAASITAFINHVSTTIMKTKLESKTNQPSLRQFLFLANDLKRTVHSNVKYTQKVYSAIWNTGSAVMSTSAKFQSVSIHIHNALSAMTTNVRFSKMLDRAMHWNTPTSW
mmetsp:Transcript_82549/g.252261  ORF Transcript_82549/g.252261 Transcript_82549/m.252261 type:complete len:273 (-) Transcript_82549:85-903(-)